tara:strand:+ start:4859 stop:5830 length:972 start_codon:yes stop_codon:yes gene_type:complete
MKHIVLSALVLSTSALAQGPGLPGDTCSNPLPVAGEGTFLWDNTGMTTSGFDGSNGAPDPICWSPLTTQIENDAFLVWTAPCGGSYSFLVSSPTITNPKRSVHLLGGCNANCVAGIDDTFFSPYIYVANVATGDEILIQVGSTNLGDTGDGFLIVARNSGPCPPSGVIISCPQPNPHSGGLNATLVNSVTGVGTPSGLHLEVTDGPAGEFAFCLISTDDSNAVALFDGVLCLGSPQGRYNPSIAANQGLPALNSLGQFSNTGVLLNISGTSVSGTGFDVPTELPFAGPIQSIQPGETWHFQYWHRDQNPVSTANFSDVAGVTF